MPDPKSGIAARMQHGAVEWCDAPNKKFGGLNAQVHSHMDTP